MNHQIKKGVWMTLLIASIACNAKKAEPVVAPVDQEQIKKIIQEKENHYASLLTAGDIGKIDYYADDAIVYAQNKNPFVGNAAIQTYLEEGLKASSPGNKLSFITEEVRVFNDADQVLEIGSFRLVDALDTLINAGHYMILFEKRDGKYVSVREMSTSDLPLE